MENSSIINETQYKKYRQSLRRNMPEPEKKLWYHLRRRQVMNVKFRRQVSIGSYIVDFMSFEKRLIIEIDGDSHFSSNQAIEYDRKRSHLIENQGFRIIRFHNSDIMNNMDGVLELIIEALSYPT